MTKKPNLFVIGAMRSGSTTLHLLLDQHQDICMSFRKEPMFYAAEEMRRRLGRNATENIELAEQLEVFVGQGKHRERASYEALFKNCGSEKFVGESSHYLYSPQVAETIFEDCPTARIIVSLRNPVDRLYSEYLYYRRVGLRSNSFSEFLREGCVVDAFGNIEEVPAASRISKGYYARLLKPWVDVFGRDSVCVIYFDEFEKDPLNTMKSTFQWLGVDSNFEPVIVKTQQGGVSRVPWLNEINKSGFFRSSIKALFPRVLREKIRSRLYSKVLVKGVIEPSDEAFLKKIYAPHIQDLEEMLEVNLSAWR